jgi:hypothetical protein
MAAKMLRRRADARLDWRRDSEPDRRAQAGAEKIGETSAQLR